MKTFLHYLEGLQKYGRWYFTKQEAIQELNITTDDFYALVSYHKKRGRVISPTQGLYIIVPPQYAIHGCIPAKELIPILCQYWDVRYYTCLLTAAMYHGATHQPVQKFQVMLEKPKKNISCGSVHIEFSFKKNMQHLLLEQRVVETGYLTIASPELTALDLITYMQKSGGINHIATVLSELVEAMQPTQLRKLFSLVPKSSVQRLGYILDHIPTLNDARKNALITVLEHDMQTRPYYYVPLAIEMPSKGRPYKKKWKIIANTTIQSDLE